MNLPPWANNGWKLLGDQRLPPVIRNFWSYDQDSWSWSPKEYSSGAIPRDNPSTLTHDYMYYIKKEEPTTIHPLITTTGGLASIDIEAIENNSLRAYPDLKSETRESKIILDNFWRTMASKGLIPRPIY